ncbi:MAG: hypothetical protein ABIT08_00460 [Bacteroidia bacterium]
MASSKENSQKQILRFRQKTKQRVVIAGSCVIALSVMLLIYFNIAEVKEMKAGSNSNNIPVEKPVDMNVSQVRIDSASINHTGADFKIAKPLENKDSAH